MHLDRHIKRFKYEIKRSRPHDKEMVKLADKAIYDNMGDKLPNMIADVYWNRNIDKVKQILIDNQPTFDWNELVGTAAPRGGEL